MVTKDLSHFPYVILAALTYLLKAVLFCFKVEFFGHMNSVAVALPHLMLLNTRSSGGIDRKFRMCSFIYQFFYVKQ